MTKTASTLTNVILEHVSLQSSEIFKYVFKLQKTNAVFDASDAIRQQLKVNDCLQSYLFQMIRYVAVQLRKSIFYSHFRHFANLMVLLRGSNNSCSAVKTPNRYTATSCILAIDGE